MPAELGCKMYHLGLALFPSLPFHIERLTVGS